MLQSLKQNMIKKWKQFVVLGFFLWHIFLSSGVFAAEESCRYCGGPPEEFSRYESFVKEVLSKIQTVWTKGNYTGKPVSPSWFQNWVFVVPPAETNMFVAQWKAKVLQVRRVLSTVSATTAILFSIGVEFLWDGVGWFLILFKTETFVFAWKTLMELDMAIHEKIFALWRSAAWWEKISAANILELEKVFAKYLWENDRLFENASLSPGVRYRHITSMLLRTNMAMKTFISGNMIWQFKNKDFTKWAGGKISLTFDYAVMELMQDRYSCARGMKWLIVNCNKAGKDFIANLAKLWWGLRKDTKKAWKIIADSIKELNKAFGTTWKQITDLIPPRDLTPAQVRQVEKDADLLRRLYGIKANNMAETSLLSKISNFRKVVTDDGSSLKSVREQFASKKIQERLKEMRAKADAKKRAEEKELERIEFEQNWWRETLICLKENREHYRLVVQYIMETDPEAKKQIDECSEVISVLNLVLSQKGKWNSALYEAISDGNVDNTIALAQKKALFAANIAYVRSNYDEMLTSVDLAANKDVTIFFVDILSQIQKIKMIIGNKDQWLIKYLWLSCEWQCENQWGTCFYPKF